MSVVIPLPVRFQTVLIGCRVTGKPEYFRDTVTGAYSEQLPPMTGDALRLQRALCPPRPTMSEWEPLWAVCKYISTRVTKWS